MKKELIIFGITAFLVANTYYDGKLLKKINISQKYVKMATFAFAGLSIYIFMRKNPNNSEAFMSSANDMIKMMPISRGTMDMITPFLDFTNNKSFSGVNQVVNEMNGGGMQQQVNRIVNSGKTGNKRSVSDAKKKWVAAQQNWRCGDCQKQLPAWFEVDHTIRLENGGTNEVSNLSALCRECHGKKTAWENIEKHGN